MHDHDHESKMMEAKHLLIAEIDKLLEGGVDSWDELEKLNLLMSTKHHLCGSFAISNLARLSLTKFVSEFSFGSKVLVIPLDDNTKSGYSHTAILAKALSNSELSPLYRALRATNSVKYAGKSLEFRRKNPRQFKLLKQIKYPVILVDDIITTGSSMLEAQKLLKRAGVRVLFGLVLADARE